MARMSRKTAELRRTLCLAWIALVSIVEVQIEPSFRVSHNNSSAVSEQNYEGVHPCFFTPWFRRRTSFDFGLWAVDFRLSPVSDELAGLKERNARLSLLIEISNVIHSTLDSEKALNLILREAVRVMRASSGSAVLINPTNGFLEIQASPGLSPPAQQLRLRVGEGITGWVARTGQPARVSDVRA